MTLKGLQQYAMNCYQTAIDQMYLQLNTDDLTQSLTSRSGQIEGHVIDEVGKLWSSNSNCLVHEADLSVSVTSSY